MADASGISDDRADGKGTSFADDIARLTDTISAAERLCLLGARSVVACAAPVPAKGQEIATFTPSVSRDMPITNDGSEHPTTSAQCIAALQGLLPVIGRFQLGTRESRDLAFHPIDRDAMKIFEPRQLEGKIRNIIVSGLNGLHGPLRRSPPTGTPAPPDPPVRSGLKSDRFDYLHPFTAAAILRAIAPSQAVYGAVWWQSLFVVLWFLNRRGSSPRGYPNIQSTNSPGTAFLTSKCVDAVHKVLNVFSRRRDRFSKLIDLMDACKDIAIHTAHIRTMAMNSPPLLSADLFVPGFEYKERILSPQIKWCIEELALDGTLPETYGAWAEELNRPTPPGKTANSTDYCTRVIDDFGKAMEREESREENAKLGAVAAAAVADAARMYDMVNDIHRAIRMRLEKEPAPDKRAEPPPAIDFDAARALLPRWLCSDDYWSHTLRAVTDRSEIGPQHKSRPFLEALESHWRRHQEAAGDALKTTTVFQSYLSAILEAFCTATVAVKAPPGLSAGPADQGRITEFLSIFSKATRHVSALRERLTRDVDVGAKWAAILMNRHLRFASSGTWTEFDPGELAHALRVVCLSDRKIGFDTVLTALRAICAAQRPDGTWVCQQPFHWDKTGFAAFTLSMETAGAVVATVNSVLHNPERYGVSLEDCSAKLHTIYLTLDRFFLWLSASLQSIRPPAPFDASSPAADPADAARAAVPRPGHKPPVDPPLYGWCSDRVVEDGRIHSWVTASAIEFLVEFRRLAQERINLLLRTEFISYHPEELKILSDVSPTDLGEIDAVARNDIASPVLDERGPAILQLMPLLQGHKLLELKEGPWLPKEPRHDISFWSGIFYGPPGTSKTLMTQAIAGELKWPLISLSPSDFLTKGADNIEARASEIFSALGSGSRLVYLFDEIDELIRDRRQAGEEQRNAFSFLTPSFLTKLQDFRKAAKNKEFIFILATNYYDRIDAAAKRSGRIDRNFLIVYPDRESRASLILQHLVDLLDPKDPKGRIETKFETVSAYLKAVEHAIDTEYKPTLSDKFPFADICATFTGSLSYQKLQDLFKARLRKPTNGLTESAILNELIKELFKISEGKSTAFKPEMELTHYALRPEAGEEISKVAAVYPRHPFPAYLHPFPADLTNATGTRLLIKRQINELKSPSSEDENKKFQADLDDIVQTLELKD
jgi:ATPase family associated with various cellular activities (AAA)